MKDRVRQLVTALLAGGALLVAGCGIIPKHYDLAIRPVDQSAADQLQQVYVIVSLEQHVNEALATQQYNDLIVKGREDSISFVTFRPKPGGSWILEEEVKPSRLVSYEIDDDTIEVQVDGDLLESGVYKLVVLATFRSGDLRTEVVPHEDLAAHADQVIEVIPGGLSARRED